ncbi:hypothetical protein [Streptomyces sp. TLI_105]|uniref:hypothetical protein n=1 Tax=Streptomyces sp. TLI_105 TaxID=1881019 RepID=UPI0015A5B9DA|nr:hypothetical protein [Streptomyces sp. TLI_105]
MPVVLILVFDVGVAMTWWSIAPVRGTARRGGPVTAGGRPRLVRAWDQFPLV